MYPDFRKNDVLFYLYAEGRLREYWSTRYYISWNTSKLDTDQLFDFCPQSTLKTKKEGTGAVKRLGQRRGKPEKLWKTKRPIYGIPDAGNAFAEKNQTDHRDKLKFEQSTIDPCIYWKFKYAENATDVPNAGEAKESATAEQLSEWQANSAWLSTTRATSALDTSCWSRGLMTCATSVPMEWLTGMALSAWNSCRWW